MTREPIAEPATTKLAPHDTFRILIMDSVTHVDQLKWACKSAGFSVVPAHSIEESFAFLEGEDHADVIVCAAYLEDEPLFEFLHRLKSHHVHHRTMFMALALAPGPNGVVLNPTVEKVGRLLGADVFISMQKFDADLLVAEIQKLLPEMPALELSNRKNKGNVVAKTYPKAVRS